VISEFTHHSSTLFKRPDFLENNIKVFRRIFYLFALSWGLVACGRDRARPTPIPASVVRPVQPTPVYARSSTFRLATPTPSVAELLTTPLTPTNALPDQFQPDTITSTINTSTINTAGILLTQTPSALAVLTVDGALLDRPAGKASVQLPLGTVLTLTGKTADGRYLAAYTNTGAAGWISRAAVTLFGASDLVVVAESQGPGAAATLVAAAMQPIHVLDTLLTATPGPTPNQ
jgi:hypothetical protein